MAWLRCLGAPQGTGDPSGACTRSRSGPREKRDAGTSIGPRMRPSLRRPPPPAAAAAPACDPEPRVPSGAQPTATEPTGGEGLIRHAGRGPPARRLAGLALGHRSHARRDRRRSHGRMRGVLSGVGRRLRGRLAARQPRATPAPLPPRSPFDGGRPRAADSGGRQAPAPFDLFTVRDS